MISYYLGFKNSCVIKRYLKNDGSLSHQVLEQNPANTDYAEYLKWLAEGNEPLPPEEN